MKYNTIKTFVMGAAAMLTLGMGFTSCSQDAAIDPLQGIYQAPTLCNITGANVGTVEKSGNLRLVMVNFTTDTGQKVNLSLVTETYFLPGTTYAAAQPSALKAGTINAKDSNIDGKGIKDGSFRLSKDGDNYECGGVVYLEDGSAIKFTGSATMVFEPEATALTNVIATYPDSGALIVILGTDGVTGEYDTSVYGYRFKGNGNAFQIKFLNMTELTEGTYAPGTGYDPAFMDYADYGMYFNTLWVNVTNDQNTFTGVDAGNIVVVKDGDDWVITLNQGGEGIYAQFKGKI